MTSEKLVQEIQSHYQRIKQASALARYYYEHYLDELKAEYQQQLDNIRKQMQSSYCWTISPWDDPVWQAYEPEADAAIAKVIRVGEFTPPNELELGALPALAPFITQGHLFVMGDERDAVQRLLQTLVLRTVVSMPAGHLRLVLADPIGSGSNLAGFLRLPESLRGHEIYVKPREIGEQMEALGQQQTFCHLRY